MVSLKKMQAYLQDVVNVQVTLWKDGRTYRAEIDYKGRHLGYFVRSGSRFMLYCYPFVYGIETSPAGLMSHVMIMCADIDKGRS